MCGEKSVLLVDVVTLRVTPRMREKMFGKNSNIQDEGSPPRMRGKGEICVPASGCGDHPAYAGKRTKPADWLGCPGCGGSPPPVRGKDPRVSGAIPFSSIMGSPPLCGEKSQGVKNAGVLRDHPACAGKSHADQHRLYPTIDGITPRVRGKAIRLRCSGADLDHPRVCGEKSSAT